MTGIGDLLDSGRYRAEVERLGPVLARHRLYEEADRRAHKIVDRLVPKQWFADGFRFEHGGQEFIRRSRAKNAHDADRMIVLDYARDQILARLERRVKLGEIVTEMLRDRI